MALSRRNVVVTCVVGLLAWGLFPSLRFVPYAFLGGLLTATAALAYVIVSVSRGAYHNDDKPLPRATSLAFTFPQISWKTEKASFRKRHVYNRASGYKPISRSIDTILDFVQRDFVKSWYGKVSSGSGFINEVDGTVRVVFARIEQRVTSQDLVDIGITRVLPIINRHAKDFFEAERAICGKNLALDVTQKDDIDTAIARKFRDGKLHPAASLAASMSIAVQQHYLRRLIGRLLPDVLPETMTTSASVLAIIREVVACAIALPVMQLLSDPDVINQIIEAYGRPVLHERKTVRKLRAALDEYASPARKRSKSTLYLSISPDDSEYMFDEFLIAIRQCDSLLEARRLRSKISRQLKQYVSAPVGEETYRQRLETAKSILDRRVVQLSASTSSGSESPMAPLSKPSIRTPILKDVALVEVLYDASALSYFMEFMDGLNLMILVQFWVVVEGLRTSLESGNNTDSDQSQQSRPWTETDRQMLFRIDQSYLRRPELRMATDSQSAVTAFLSAGSQAMGPEYEAARKAILRMQTEVFAQMQTQYFPRFKCSNLYVKWLGGKPTPSSTSSPLRNILDPPQHARGSFLKPAIPSMRPINLRRGSVSSSNLIAVAQKSKQSAGPRRSLDGTSYRPPLFEDDDNNDTDPLAHSMDSLNTNGELSVRTEEDRTQVVAAVQAALDDIIDNGPGEELAFSKSSLNTSQDSGSGPGSLESTPQDAPLLTSDSEKPSLSSLGLVGTSTRRPLFSQDDLFDEQEDTWDGNGDYHVMEKTDEGEVQQATPGDLGLSELVQSLTLEISKLEVQQSIVQSLTRKSEVTNNVAELRILRKSSASLEEELHRKQLQKQQYMVQETENTLYGRATISIKKIIVGTEADGHEFASYIVEVQRQGAENTITASWAVPRRYSEFHDLHKCLRVRYPVVRDLEFPRRQIVLTLQKSFLKKRRTSLERYLRELLKMEAICRSFELRAFLSQQRIRPLKGANEHQIDKQDLVTRIYNSVTDSMEELGSNLPVLDQLSLAGQNLISAATSTPAIAVGRSTSFPPVRDDDPVIAFEAQAEITGFESERHRDTTTFIKPICDIFLEIFQLNHGNNWLRGRAVIVVLQQLLGGTVERKVRESFKVHTSEESMVKYIELLQNTMWPEGKLRSSLPVRTEAEKAASRKEAAVVLASLVPDLAGSVVGRSNATKAGRRIFATLQNARLNQHLAYVLLDELVDALFGVRVGR